MVLLGEAMRWAAQRFRPVQVPGFGYTEQLFVAAADRVSRPQRYLVATEYNHFAASILHPLADTLEIGVLRDSLDGWSTVTFFLLDGLYK